MGTVRRLLIDITVRYPRLLHLVLFFPVICSI